MPVIQASEGSVEVLTPCGDPAVLEAGTAVTRVDVVIDPGHGGPVDTGAVGANGLAEKEVNLRVGLALLAILEDRSIPALMTRTGDYPIPIPTRASYADMVGARALVSIHHNAPVAPASQIPGVEVFVQKDSTESQRLGGLLYREAVDGLGSFDIDWDRAPDAGVMTVLNTRGDDAYGMVRRPVTPSALIELGYIANRVEAELFATPSYVDAAAEAMADAIEEFLDSDAEGEPLGEGRVFDPRPGVGRDQCIEPDLFESLYPEVIAASVSQSGDAFEFTATVRSPYDSPERYADAWRVVGDDGVVYGIRELTHDHANEQPFTRSLSGVVIPDQVEEVIVEARDLVYGWGGGTVVLAVP